MRDAVTIEYVQQRRAFGVPVASCQNTGFELAAVATEVEAAQAMLDRAVLELVGGELSGCPDFARTGGPCDRRVSNLL
jgi:acyl-CoA dehydrogenase